MKRKSSGADCHDTMELNISSNISSSIVYIDKASSRRALPSLEHANALAET
jgi:hypothetical protein